MANLRRLCDSFTVVSQNFIFAVIDRWLTYDYETEYSFVYLINTIRYTYRCRVERRNIPNSNIQAV